MPGVRFRYTTIEVGDIDIHIRILRDKLQFHDKDGTAKKLGISSAAWPISGVIWPSGEVLAHLMRKFNVEDKRILEVGCGIALASLLLNQRLANITATDHHPETETYLRYNTRLNNGKEIPFVRTGWAEKNKDRLGLFDLIIGSDLLYESEHVELLAGFINQHARHTCDVVIVDPGRGFQAKFSKKMIRLGFSYYPVKVENTDYLPEKFNGRVLTFSR